MYDPVDFDADLLALQNDQRKRRIVERAREEEQRDRATISLEAQMSAADVERSRRAADRRDWLIAGLWSAAFVSCVAVLVLLVLYGAW